MFHSVQAWASRIAVSGIPIAAVAFIVPNMVARNIVASAGSLLTSSGLVVLSTCPVERTDLDAALESRPKLTACLGMACLVQAGLQTWRFGSPWLHALAVGPSLLLTTVFCRKRAARSCAPRPSRLLSAIVAGLMAGDCNGAAKLYSNNEVMVVSLCVVGSLGTCFVVTLWWMPCGSLAFLLAQAKCFLSFYTYFLVRAVSIIIIAAFEYTPLFVAPSVTKVIHGLCLGTPVFALLLLGPRRLFNLAAKRFELSLDRAQQDGAFVACLLDGCAIEMGQEWFVHKQEGTKASWERGRVIEVTEHDFAVEVLHRDARVQGSPRFPLPAAGSSQELLKTAKDNLRCVEWTDFSEDLLRSNVCARDTDSALAKAVKVGCAIDRFLSHSWHDDGHSKMDMLRQFAEEFWARYRRQPTFWFDKCCIEQSDIQQGLRVLPVNIMSCRKVLVAWGPTYPTRLWCVWELFTVLAFTGLEAAVRRIQFRSLTDATLSECRARLVSFNVADAHCYDPNEERRLREIIAALGEDGFNARIHALGDECGHRELPPSRPQPGSRIRSSDDLGAAASSCSSEKLHDHRSPHVSPRQSIPTFLDASSDDVRLVII